MLNASTTDNDAEPQRIIIPPRLVVRDRRAARRVIARRGPVGGLPWLALPAADARWATPCCAGRPARRCRRDLGAIELARERERVIAAAKRYLKDAPSPSPPSRSPRSAGGPHDFFSEGDYWWPDPQNPGRPVHPAGRDEQSRQLRRSSPRADAAVGRDAGARRRRGS